MHKINLLLVCVLGLLVGQARGQTIQDFRYLKDPIQSEGFLSVGLDRVSLANPAAPNPDSHRVSVFNIYLDLQWPQLERGQASIFYTNPLLTDLVLLLRNVVDNPNNIYRAEGSGLSSGPLGWFQVGWNVNGPGVVQGYAGLNLHDYFLTPSYQTDAGLLTQEPQGYYFSAGPTAGLRAALGGAALLDFRGMYGFSYWRATSVSYAERDDSQPKPHWLHLQMDLLSKWGFFAGFQYHQVINRSQLPNATRRTNALIGFRLML